MSAIPVPSAQPVDRHFGLLTGPGAVLARRRLDRWILAAPVMGASFVAKLSVPPFGGMGLSLAIPLNSAFGVVGLLMGRLVFDKVRLIAYLAVLSMLWGIQVMRGEPFSPTSLLLFTVLHFPYTLHLKRQPDYREVLASFQRIAVIIASLGVLQYVVQFFVGPTLAFPVENFFPEAFKVTQFNMQGYTEYGSEVYRTNGVFMLEPSFYAQFLAVAVIIELLMRRRLWAIGLFLCGMVVSYSGTGLMVLFACLPFLAISKRRWDLLIGGVVLGAGLIGVAGLIDNPYINIFFKRAGEFTAPGSSGFARFVGGFYLFEQFLWPDPLRALFGFGAGSLLAYKQKATWAAGENAVFKMIFEYGLVGGLAYLAFIVYCVKQSAAPVMLRLGVGLTYLLGGIYVPFAHCLVLGLLVWPNGKPLESPALPRSTP